jgi:hypothetical protein
MRRTFLLLLAVTATAAAPAFAQQARDSRATASPRPGADTVKVGSYDLEITTDDGTMVGSLTVKKGDKGELAVALNAGGRIPAVKSFVRQGPEYLLTVGHEEFVIVYKLAFARDSVAGSFSGSGGLSGTVLGVYKR